MPSSLWPPNTIVKSGTEAVSQEWDSRAVRLEWEYEAVICEWDSAAWSQDPEQWRRWANE